MSVSNGSTIWHIGLQCVSELAYVCRSMIRHVDLRPSMLVSNMGMSVSNKSPMKHVDVSDEACQGHRWSMSRSLLKMSRPHRKHVKIFRVQEKIIIIGDLLKTHQRPKCLIRDQCDTKMLYQRPIWDGHAPIGDRHAPSETDMLCRRSTYLIRGQHTRLIETHPVLTWIIENTAETDLSYYSKIN